MMTKYNIFSFYFQFMFLVILKTRFSLSWSSGHGCSNNLTPNTPRKFSVGLNIELLVIVVCSSFKLALKTPLLNFWN